MALPAAPLFRLGGTLLSRGSRLTILHYHQVLESVDPMRPDVFDAAEFAVHMSVLADAFNVIPLAEGVHMLGEGRLPSRAVAISFDDGYADNYEVALPVIRHYGLTATFFVASGYLDGGCMFNDLVIEACRHAPSGNWSTGLEGVGDLPVDDTGSRLAARDRLLAALKYLPPQQREYEAVRLLADAGGRRPDRLMMSSEQLLQLSRAGMDIGAHTRTHPILAEIDASAAEAEIIRGRDELATITGRTPALFAYPNGKPEIDFIERDVSLARRLGFEAAVTTEWGSAAPASDLFRLPRLASWDRTALRFALRLLQVCLSPR